MDEERLTAVAGAVAVGGRDAGILAMLGSVRVEVALSLLGDLDGVLTGVFLRHDGVDWV